MDSKLSSEDIRKQLLTMAVDITKTLDEHKIPYILTYGTLLGAVRHSGFIPWDDDFDIAIPATYQKKAIQVLSNISKYHFLSLASDDYYDWVLRVTDKSTKTTSKETEWEVYNHTMSREDIGLCVDIYPFYCLPDNAFKFKTHKFFTKVSSWLIRKSFAKKSNFIKKLGFAMLSLRANASEGKYYTDAGQIYYQPTLFTQTEYINFEEFKFRAPTEPEKFLERRYGDWQKLPTQEEIDKAIHYEETFWR
ncbi:LicD family protein [Pseudoalteromonas shioyasakiensis]|uniref:LicD family protein n=1 Tax=Pseudoalteromonas shioyasakiensis TaxID=1190813 RepID=UPI002551F57C|nr:LicD family protein [Pseudoalteromonas shioyasakiensis]MDK9684936.1 LicD family protein [Pseudoalteromonas shioyasakiensis]